MKKQDTKNDLEFAHELIVETDEERKVRLGREVSERPKYEIYPGE